MSSFISKKQIIINHLIFGYWKTLWNNFLFHLVQTSFNLFSRLHWEKGIFLFGKFQPESFPYPLRYYQIQKKSTVLTNRPMFIQDKHSMIEQQKSLIIRVKRYYRPVLTRGQTNNSNERFKAKLTKKYIIHQNNNNTRQNYSILIKSKRKTTHSFYVKC